MYARTESHLRLCFLLHFVLDISFVDAQLTISPQLRSSQGPLTPGAQPAHLRRESSQSTHSDISGAGMGRGGFGPNARGRGGFIPSYGNHSPAQNFRQMSNSRGPPNNMQGQYQNQQLNNSPYNRGRGSPAMMPVQPHMPQNGPPQMQYGGYPQHLGPQYNVSFSACVVSLRDTLTHPW